MRKCHFCARFICDVMVAFETAKIESGSNTLKLPLFTTFCKLNKWISLLLSASLYLNLGNVAKKAKTSFILLAQMIVEN